MLDGALHPPAAPSPAQRRLAASDRPSHAPAGADPGPAEDPRSDDDETTTATDDRRRPTTPGARHQATSTRTTKPDERPQTGRRLSDDSMPTPVVAVRRPPTGRPKHPPDDNATGASPPGHQAHREASPHVARHCRPTDCSSAPTRVDRDGHQAHKVACPTLQPFTTRPPRVHRLPTVPLCRP